MTEPTWFTIGVAAVLGIVAGASTLAVAQGRYGMMRSMTDSWGPTNVVGQLASNEGIHVDAKEFRINKGAAKGDPSDQIVKSGAKEVSEGAIIFRSGGTLYIVDGKPAAQ